jgi:hypothetical protein
MAMEMTTELWIEGYEEHYSINTFGDVFSWKYGSKKQLKRNINTKGYQYYCLSLNNKVKNITVHKLVAQTFISNRPKNMQINHIDGDKFNNQVLNLEYVTPSQNINHAYNNGLMNNVFKGLTEKNSRILLDTETGIFYNSIKEASKYLCIDYSKLMNMVCGTQKNKTNLIYA